MVRSLTRPGIRIMLRQVNKNPSTRRQKGKSKE